MSRRSFKLSDGRFVVFGWDHPTQNFWLSIMSAADDEVAEYESHPLRGWQRSDQLIAFLSLHGIPLPRTQQELAIDLNTDRFNPDSGRTIVRYGTVHIDTEQEQKITEKLRRTNRIMSLDNKKGAGTR